LGGRDFERIDLNTRWAGFAILPSALVQSIGELPEDWSIGSSLLRHAVQSGTSFVPVAQSRLQEGDVMRMDSQADATALANNILKMRVNSASGYIERCVFGPVGKHLAPLIWRNSSLQPMVYAAAPAAAFASFGFSAVGWTITAATSALLAMMLDHISRIACVGDYDPRANRWHNRVFWLLLTASALASAWRSTEQPIDALWFTAAVVSLTYYSENTALPRWSAGLLKSPALVSLGLLIAAIFAGFETGARFVGLAQIALLIASQHYPRTRTQNSIQA
jgi:hypothetical protein